MPHMVARSDSLDTPKKWQHRVANPVTDSSELFTLLDLATDSHGNELAGALRASEAFPLRFPRSLINQLGGGNPDHPITRQFLPSAAELNDTAGYSDDPLAEQDAQPVPGLLHKYSGRVLLVTTQVCAVHCRYCFRRHYPYADQRDPEGLWQQAMAYIEQRQQITEVILSGGDPLSLVDQKLTTLIKRLEKIPHLTTLRIHSRTAALFPERITPALVELLENCRLNVVLVTHINHPLEISDQLPAALAPLQIAGIKLLNQSVLLKGVNDGVEPLSELSEKLFSTGILPYYLHLPDRVSGTAHFAVDEETGKTLVNGLRGRLPGYLVPRLVREVAHEAGKTLIG